MFASSLRSRRFHAGHKLALDRARMAAEFRDDVSVFARDRDVIDSGAAAALAFDRAGDELVPELCRREKGHRAMLRHGALIVSVAGKGEGGIRERENVSAVTKFV